LVAQIRANQLASKITESSADLDALLFSFGDLTIMTSAIFHSVSFPRIRLAGRSPGIFYKCAGKTLDAGSTSTTFELAPPIG
jgi:hypothetical protein